MRTKSLLYFLGTCVLLLAACGPSAAEIATQTAVAQTIVAVSWTDTPTLMPTLTLTPVPTETQTSTPTLSPDLCLPENLPDAIDTYNDIFTRFQNVSTIAANLLPEQIPDEITKLQDLRQAAQDQATPPCLKTLRDHQLKHMDLVIDALTSFADGKGDVTVRNIVQDARAEHDEYMRELMRLLNISPTPWLR